MTPRHDVTVHVSLLLVALAGCTNDAAKAREALARGKQLAAWHRDADAAAALHEALALDPRLHEAHGRLARLALDASRFAEAKTEATEALVESARAPYYLELLGRAELGLGDEANALDSFTEAMAADASLARLGFDVGRIHERRHELPEAATAYRALAHADPRSLEARVALAHVLLPGPPRDEARRALLEARPLAAPGTPLADEVDGLLAWCDRLDAPPTAVPADVRARVSQMGILRLLGSGDHGSSVRDLFGGDTIGDSFGSGGLGLVGTGRGGGGTGEGIGLGGLGTIGHGGGAGTGAGMGYGTGGFVRRAQPEPRDPQRAPALAPPPPGATQASP